MIMHFIRLMFVLSFTNIYATQEFTWQVIDNYLTNKNLYIYKALGKKDVAQEQLNFNKGMYDTQLIGKYDEKDYLTGYGLYYDLSLKKPTEFGIDLSLGYRYSDGIQDYNNIKTDKNGELILGVKIPLISVLNKIDERRFRVNLAKMNLKKTKFQYNETMRDFYFNLMTSYFTLLYKVEIEKLFENILYKMKERKDFLKRSVEKGNLPHIVLLEAKQQVLHAKQNYISVRRDSTNKLVEFLKYLNISYKEFKTNYHLPNLPDTKQINFNFNKALEIAIENRPEFKILRLEKEKLILENKNNEINKYPKLDIGINGIYNENEKSGFKVSLNMNFPLAQSQYKAKSAEIKKSVKVIKNEKDLQLVELKSDLSNIINSLHLIVESITNSQEERKLLQELEKLEKRKYQLGSSTLFMLNQRETLTVQSEVKLLEYKLQYQLLYQVYKRVINSKNDFFNNI